MGCHIDNIFVGCIAYADDILLLSASVVHLHKMLDFSQFQGEKLNAGFNPNKCSLFTFGKYYKELLANMHFGAGDITWVDTMKYLGINFVSCKRVKIDICPLLRKFYASVNTVNFVNNFVSSDVCSFLCIILSYVYLIYFYVCVCCLHWRKNVFTH